MKSLLHHKLYGVIFVFLALVTMVGLTQRASAVSYELPDRNTISNPDGSYPNNGGVMIEIAQPGSNIYLNVNEAWAKVYIPAGSPDLKIQIYDGDFGGCGSNTVDTEGNNAACTDPNAVNYEFYYADNTNGGASPAPGAPFQTLNSSYFEPPTNNGNGNWVFTPAFPLPGGGPINTGSGSYYILYVKGVWASGGSDRINGFKVGGWYGGSLTSYWGYSSTSPGQPSGAGYAVQDRSYGDDTEEDMSFQFASPCSESGSPTVWLKWTDADAYGAPNTGIPEDGNQFPGDQEINFELQEANIGATSGGVILSVNPGGSNSNAIGGNGDYREVSFAARPDKVYIWKWKGVNRLNGVQMWLPYDSFYFAKNCSSSKQARGVIDGWDCNTIPGWAYDEDSPNTAVGIHIYVNNPAPGSPGDFYDYGATDQASPDINNNAGLPNAPTAGNHRFRWTIPNKYKDGSPHRFYIYVRGVDGAGNGGGSDGDSNNPEITAYSNGASFGSFTCGGTIVGRAFYDDNGNTVMDAGERIVESPAGACGATNVPVNGISVSIVSTGATSSLDKCNTDASIAPGLLASYKLSAPAGSQTINLNLPAGWISTNGSSRTFTVTDGGTISATKAQYFGVQIRPPTVVTKCLNSVSLADISWGPAVIPAASFFADIDDGPPTPSFSQYWNKGTGAATTTTAPGVPSSFNAFPAAGPALDFNAVAPGSPYSVRIYYNGPNVHTASASFVTKGCPKLTCGALNAIPTQPEDSVTFNMTVSFNNIGAGDLNAGANLGVVFPGYYNNANTPYTNRPLLAGQTGISNPISLNVAAGVYMVTWTVTGDPASNDLIDPNPPPSATCRQTLSVSRKPYFRVFGGDVLAGSNAVACPKWFPHTLTSFGSIQAFSNGSGNGAGTQLVAQALAAINGFSSAQSRTTSPVPDKGLSFSNTNGDPTYGGSFLAGGCPPDFWASKPPVVTSNSNNYTIPASASGAYLYQPSSGNLDLKAASDKLTNGTVLTLYVEGNVTITRDIADEFTSWASVNEIPSLVVIAHGNIFIDKDVSTIDAVLVAQPIDAANGGYIYTCSIGNALPSPSDMADPAGACKANPLTITGAVVARTVKLFRSSGSLKNSTNAELASGPTANAAERFVYSPEVWLRANDVRGTPSLGTYDAVTGLPPVF